MNKISINHNFNSALRLDVRITAFIDKRETQYYIDIPSFNINTYAKSPSDIEIAIKEALICFFTACKSHGEGIERELKMSGWAYAVENNLPIFDAGIEYEFVGNDEPNPEYLPPGIIPDKMNYQFSINLSK